MPEGDTVWLSAQQLHQALAGDVLTRGELRVPRHATADLTGREVLAVVPRGKHLLFRLAGGLTLHTHFEMDGSWRIYPPGARWTGGPAHQIRAVLATARSVAVGYRLPVVDLLRTADEHAVVGHLGPDLLGPDWDPDAAVRRLAARPDRQIAPALLDQRNLAGIGNLYKSEALFLHGVTPWTPVGEAGDLHALVTRAQRLLDVNKQRWKQVTTGDPRRPHWVFERGGKPCRRCGERVRSAEQAEPDHPERARLSYWCGRCQTGPAPASGVRR